MPKVDEVAVALATSGRLRWKALQEDDRRAAVAQLIRAGMSESGAADRLGVSVKTVREYKPRATTGGAPSQGDGRDRVYTRSGRICECCGMTKGQSWSHRLPKSGGGPWSASNGLHTCGSGSTGCHGWIEENPIDALGPGWRVMRGQNWTAIPVLIWHRGARVWALLDDEGGVSVLTDREVP